MSQGDKRFEPTPKRLHDARRRGDVWKSIDLTVAASLLGGVIALGVQGEALAAEMRSLARAFWGSAGDGVLPADLPTMLGRACIVAGMGLVAIVVVPLACGWITGLAQVRPMFSLEALEPKMERLQPSENLRRIFSVHGVVELLKAVAKLAIVAGLCAWVVHESLREVLRMGLVEPSAVAGRMGALARGLAMRVGVVLLVLGLLDAIFQRRHWMSKLRMTQQEMEQSQKESGQDPDLLLRRRRAREEMKQRSFALRTAPEWDVLTLNPTHLACALRYDPARDVAPRLLAKGRGQLAQDMIKVARARGVPIIRKKSLTRALYQLRTGSQVPRPLHAAVKLVLDWVEEDVGRRGRKVRWARASPQP